MSEKRHDPLGGAVSMLGGSFSAEPHPCRHAAPTTARPWVGAPGTVGTIAVIGSGKIGLPLGLQFASHGWRVHAVDINPALVEAINSGTAPWGGEPGLAEALAEHVGSGRLRATTDGPAAVRDADVALVVVPVLVREDGSIADRALVGATETLIAGAHDDLLVILETTVPIGTTRDLVAKIAKASGTHLYGCFSPERVLTGQTFRNLAAYPKLVGGTDAASLERAAAFYESVLDAPIARMATLEAAEMAKLAETTYRDVNIALANEFARVADRHGIDLSEVIRAANSQPYSHIHEPGIGVGGHCIPVYPRMILATDGDLDVIKAARGVNDAQVEHAADALEIGLGTLDGAKAAVLGLTYREGVRELAHARGPLMAAALQARGATVVGHDPLLSSDDVRGLGMEAWDGKSPLPGVRAVVVATADAAYRTADFATLFPDARLFVDGRNACAGATLPQGARRLGFGRPGGVAAGRRP